ncbi:hypothetical protein ACO0LB_18055 [Undibacterium sp. SXout7W]|uniref:hypothetical protein n=1 Tax=Undibacterium sp. SXout7W TaxID=3413049 RepID=UPI003BF0AC91
MFNFLRGRLGRLFRPHRPGAGLSLFERHLLTEIGYDLDTRRLHWGIPKEESPTMRLDICLAAYKAGGMFAHVDKGKVYIDLRRVFIHHAAVINHGGQGRLAGGAFYTLAITLGYDNDPKVFELLDALDLDAEFLRGFRQEAVVYGKEILKLIPVTALGFHPHYRRTRFSFLLRYYYTNRKILKQA